MASTCLCDCRLLSQHCIWGCRPVGSTQRSDGCGGCTELLGIERQSGCTSGHCRQLSSASGKIRIEPSPIPRSRPMHPSATKALYPHLHDGQTQATDESVDRGVTPTSRQVIRYKSLGKVLLRRCNEHRRISTGYCNRTAALAASATCGDTACRA